MPKWFHITISVLLALLAIGFSILICGKHHWGYIPCAAIAILLFGCFYGLLRLCFWAGAKIALSYVEAYQKHVRPRIEVEAIQKYIAEHPVEKPVQQSPIEEMAEHNQILNQEERLRRFMETCKREREQFVAIKEKADEEKLAKVQAYVRQTLMPFDFTDEELFQVSECVVSLVVHGVVVPTLPIKIEKTGKKEQLTQHDLANLSWNIANQYNIPNKLAAQFAQYTFPAWFWDTTTDTLAKKLKNRSNDLHIMIDERIIDSSCDTK